MPHTDDVECPRCGEPVLSWPIWCEYCWGTVQCYSILEARKRIDAERAEKFHGAVPTSYERPDLSVYDDTVDDHPEPTRSEPERPTIGDVSPIGEKETDDAWKKICARVDRQLKTREDIRRHDEQVRRIRLEDQTYNDLVALRETSEKDVFALVTDPNFEPGR